MLVFGGVSTLLSTFSMFVSTHATPHNLYNNCTVESDINQIRLLSLLHDDNPQSPDVPFIQQWHRRILQSHTMGSFARTTSCPYHKSCLLWTKRQGLRWDLEQFSKSAHATCFVKDGLHICVTLGLHMDKARWSDVLRLFVLEVYNIYSFTVQFFSPNYTDLACLLHRCNSHDGMHIEIHSRCVAT